MDIDNRDRDEVIAGLQERIRALQVKVAEQTLLVHSLENENAELRESQTLGYL